MPLIHTFTGLKLEPFMNPDLARTITVKLAPSLTLAAGTVLGRVAATNLWVAYATAAVDGSGVARAILQYSAATDAAGKHFFGASAVSEHGQFELSVPAYGRGDFLVADLTGFDADALADLQARLIYGDDLADTANAVIHIG